MALQVRFDSMRFGAHVSVAGKIHMAVDRAVELGCECLQIFSSNPRMWKPAPLDPTDVAIFREKRRAAKLDPLVLHAPYLVNLASADPQVFDPSLEMLGDALERGHALAADYLVFHVGSAVGADHREALHRVVGSLRSLLERDRGVKMLLENTAGAGSSLGASFEELAWLLEHAGGGERVGICLDTCHAYVADYDLSSAEAVEQTFADFDRLVGLDRLKVIHANDSRHEPGSHYDRHYHIGEGMIGEAGFRAIVRHPQLQDKPCIIETPKEEGRDQENIAKLRRLQQ